MLSEATYQMSICAYLEVGWVESVSKGNVPSNITTSSTPAAQMSAARPLYAIAF